MLMSAVIPVYNEEESLDKFYKRLAPELKKLDKSYEIIFVDDGSNDSSLSILKKLASKDKNVKVFSFRRNRGKAEALTAGFQAAKGDYIVTLDADLQDRPEEIKKLLDYAKKNNYDMVSGWRKFRSDPLKKRLSSKVFNYIISLWGVKLNDYNSGLKLYSKEAAKSLNLYGGMHRFIPLLAYQGGFDVTEIPVEHDKRQFGKSKYGFSKLWKDIPDMFTMLFLTRYATKPLHFFGLIGSIIFGIGFVILVYLSVLHFQGHAIGDRPLFLLGILFMLVAFQILFTGFLADLMIHVTQNHNGPKTADETLFKFKSN